MTPSQDEVLRRYARWVEQGRVIASDLRARRVQLLEGQRELERVDSALDALVAGNVTPRQEDPCD